MAQLNIILGPSHTGKSTYILDRIEQHMKKGQQAVLIVPDQASYYYERRLCDRAGGLIGVEVYGFERLCERLISRHGTALPVLSDQGRCMVLRRAAHRQKKELQLFSRTAQLKGFAASMDTRISKFKQCCISPSELEAAAEKLPSTDLLRQKLIDFSILYRESEAFLEKHYLTSNDLLLVAAPLIPNSFLHSSHVYIDDAEHLNEQTFRLLLQIMLTAKSVTITLRGTEDPALKELFLPDTQLLEKLKAVCASNGIPITEKRMQQFSQIPDPAIVHLENNLFSASQIKYPYATEAVTVLAAVNRQAEVSLVADRILESVRSGKRFSDFAIIASDLAAYAPILKRAFHLRSIPLFYDATRPIIGLASTDFVVSTARAACLGFPMSDILRILKSGYAGVRETDAEIFENYVLRYGIYGSELKAPFTVGDIPPEAESVRSHLMETLLPLQHAMESKKTSHRVRALWACLNDFLLREQLEAEAQSLLNDGLLPEAQLVAQIWKAIHELLTQTDTVLGETELTLREFPMLLEEGLSGFSVGVLPGQRDSVTLGDLSRSRIAPVSTLFFLGCSEGLFPPVRTDDDLINDDELERLRSLGLPVWEGTQSESASDRLALYSLLSKARNQIVLSYPCSEGGSEQMRAPLLTQILSIFPENKEISALEDSRTLPMSRPVAFASLAHLVSELKQDAACSSDLPVLLDYFRDDPVYGHAAKALMSDSTANPSPGSLGKAAAKALYGYNPSMSASRLEQFARCPFAQYLKYGLRAEERKTAAEKAADAGTFLHDALDAFVRAVESGPYDWNSITPEEIDSVLRVILPEILAAHNDGIFSRDPRLKESLFLRIRTVRQCAYSIVRQLKAGRFEVRQTEMSFGMDDTFDPVWLTLSDGSKVRIYGKIDRVDQTPDKKHLRIIDYKMGKNRKFDPTKLLSGESLQLPLYFAAAEQLGGDCAGLYYMPLTLDPPEEGDVSEHMLYGLTSSDSDAVDAAERFDGKSTLIHNLKYNRDGILTGAVASSARIEEIIAAAERIAAKQAEGILNGEAEIAPTESACKWCPYRSVCRFDKQNGCRNRYVRKIELKDLLSGKEDLP